MGNIIAPNGAVNSYLENKEQRTVDKIKAILEEEGCFICPSVSVEMNSFGMGISKSSWAVFANERMKKE